MSVACATDSALGGTSHPVGLLERRLNEPGTKPLLPELPPLREDEELPPLRGERELENADKKHT